MKINHKGYSLTELLLTLAIFSIVMVTIIQIMSISSKNYKEENFDIKLQQGATVLMSQFDELLMGCKDISVNQNTYKIETDTGKTYYIKYAQEDNRLYLSDNNTKYEILADYIASFEIKGLEGSKLASLKLEGGSVKAENTEEDKNASDNSCTVCVSFNNDGHVYDCSKIIYFRNNIESKDKHTYNLEDGTPAVEEDNQIVRDVKRYEIVNLEKEYGIVSDYFFWDPNKKGGFRFMDGDYSENVPNECPTDILSGFITTSLTYNNAHHDYITKEDGVYVSGKNQQGVEVRVYLTISEVSIDAGNNILEVNLSGSSEEGTHSFINFEGFDVQSAIKARKKIQWTEQIYYDNVAFDEVISRSNLDLRTTSGVANPDDLPFRLSGENTYIGYNCFSDPLGKGIVLVSAMESFRNVNSGFDSAEAQHSIALLTDHKIEIEFSFDLPGKTTPYTTRMRVYCGGCDLTDMN